MGIPMYAGVSSDSWNDFAVLGKNGLTSFADLGGGPVRRSSG